MYQLAQDLPDGAVEGVQLPAALQSASRELNEQQSHAFDTHRERCAGDELLEAATAAYTQAVILLPTAPSWLDLAMSYSGRLKCSTIGVGTNSNGGSGSGSGSRGRGEDDSSGDGGSSVRSAMVDVMMRAALGAAKKAVSLDVGSAAAWTTLGGIAIQCDKPALAQHACIKALGLGSVNALPWINLGAL